MPDYIVYISPKGFEADLKAELAYFGIKIIEQRERLFLCEKSGPALQTQPVWAQNTWLEPTFISVASIGQAASALKALQRNWALHPTVFFRRAALIEAKLPPVSGKPLIFGAALPCAPLGAWTLWTENQVLASQNCSSPFAEGEVSFEENKIDPPGRAYLKLWEALTLLGKKPQPEDICLDLGSSPGGWTWVLASLGAQVISLDKSPLADNVATMANVHFRAGSAFDSNNVGPEILENLGFKKTETGQEEKKIDWICSDVICYPDRLLKLVQRWLQANCCRNFVCTIKLQGELQAGSDFEIIDQFRAIPGSQLMHLSHNKHEVTWALLED